MWSRLKEFTNVCDGEWEKVESYLCKRPEDVTQTDEDVQKKDERLELEEEQDTQMTDSSTETRVRDDWMQTAFLAASNNLEIVVVANGQRFVVLGEKLDVRDKSKRLTVCCMQETEAGQQITAVFCLPLASSRRTETKPHDWTCVIVGTDTGHLLFYTERGTLVYKQHFHAARVVSIQFGASLHGSQELSVLYSNCLLCIDGLSLYTALKGSKSHVARGGSTSAEELAQIIELVFKKWQPEKVEKSLQHVSTGPMRPSAFDQLTTASVHGGMDARIKPAPPTFATYCTTGSEPFLTFAWQEDALAQPALSDAFYSLADKLKTSVSSGFLGKFSWSSSSTNKTNPPAKPPPASVRPTSMTTRTVLQDSGRQGERVYLAPNSHLAAVADAQARVVLIDTTGRRIVRMWKGYRDAECAWVESCGRLDSEDEAPNARALFLVIFAPRRGLLEVWAMQNGPRVGAFNVDKGGRLLSACCSGILGSSDQDTRTHRDTCCAWFINSGSFVQEIVVPFHVALQDASVSQAHDDTVMRQLNICLSDLNTNEEATAATFQDLFNQLKTVSARRSAVELMLSKERFGCSLLGRLFDYALSYISADAAKCPLSIEELVLRTHCIACRQLLNAFAIISRINWEGDDQVKHELAQDKDQNIAQLLHVSEEELKDYLSALGSAARKSPEEKQNPLTFKDLVACFDLSRLLSSRQVERRMSTDEHDWIRMFLKEELEMQQLVTFGRFLFDCVLVGRCALKTFQQVIVPQLGLSPEQLMRLLCAYWLGSQHTKSVYPPRLYRLILAIAENVTDVAVLLDNVHAEIFSSEHIPEAFTLCLIVRAFAKSQQNRNDAFDWEQIQVSLEKWDLSVWHLFCLLLLSSLPQQPDSKSEVNPSQSACSLQELLNRGQGFYREQIGRWAAANFVDVGDLCKILESEQSDASVSWAPIVKQLQRRLPLSCKRQLLLCDCCWEQCSAWNKEPDCVERLEHSLAFLAQMDCPVLQHGIAFLLWDTFVQTRFKALCALLDKVGRFPKDRLCRREVGVSDVRLVAFARCCNTLLRLLRDSNADRDFVPAPVIEYEDFLDNLFSLTSLTIGSDLGSREPLAELAVRQKCTNYQLVVHHWHLTLVTLLQLEWSLKPARPSQLFDDKGKRAFFVSFYSYPLLSMADVSDDLRNTRQDLCARCIRTSVDLETSDTSNVFVLAGEWGLDLDALRREHVVGLYRTGRDIQAEQLLSAVWNKQGLADQLMSLLSSRIRAFFEKFSSQIDKWAALTARSVAWIKSAPALPDNQEHLADLTLIMNLTAQLRAMVSPQSKEVPILAELADVLTNFSGS